MGRPIEPKSRKREYYERLITELGRLETSVQIDDTIDPALQAKAQADIAQLKPTLLELRKRVET